MQILTHGELNEIKIFVLLCHHKHEIPMIDALK